MPKSITLVCDFDSEAEVEALAQFLKRVSFATCERHSDPTRKNEPYLMMAGLITVRRALADQGYSPR